MRSMLDNKNSLVSYKSLQGKGIVERHVVLVLDASRFFNKSSLFCLTLSLQLVWNFSVVFLNNARFDLIVIIPLISTMKRSSSLSMDALIPAHTRIACFVTCDDICDQMCFLCKP